MPTDPTTNPTADDEAGASADHAPIDAGSPAPEWSLPGDGDRTVSSNREGRPLVLFLYPKDDTSGCTREAVAFSALKPEFDAIGVEVVGLSPDGPKSHDRFVAKHSLTVPLASDEDKAVIGALGAWVEKSMYGRSYMGVDRSTFLIDGGGRVARAWRKVKVPGHAEEVLEAARELVA